jgi:hypothetical protein
VGFLITCQKYAQKMASDWLINDVYFCGDKNNQKDREGVGEGFCSRVLFTAGFARRRKFS